MSVAAVRRSLISGGERQKRENARERERDAEPDERARRRIPSAVELVVQHSNPPNVIESRHVVVIESERPLEGPGRPSLSLYSRRTACQYRGKSRKFGHPGYN